VPAPFRAVIQRALLKDPDKRFASVGEMLGAFTAASTPATTMPVKYEAKKPAALPPLTPVPAANSKKKDDPFYIGDDEREMQFGPMQQSQHKGRAKVIPTAIVTPATQPVTEPIAKAVVAGSSGFVSWWNHGSLNTPVKVALILGITILAAVNSFWLIPVLVALGCVYVLYLGVRMLALAGQNAPVVTAQAVSASPNGRQRRPLTLEQYGRQTLAMKTLGDRIGELSGSMLGSALIAAILSLVMLIVMSENLQHGGVAIWNFYAWLALTTTAGSWIALTAGKFWEPRAGEEWKRRFIQLVLGLGLATFAFATSQALMIGTSASHAFNASGINDSLASQTMYKGQVPGLTAFLAYFGAVFATVGWWKQTDPLRGSRLQVGPLAVTLLAAFLWSLAWPFPQPWGVMIAGAISITVQLSASWFTPQDRLAMKQAAQNARV
jgi:hypothetical protein